MNSKARVLAQINHQETDLVPYTLTFETEDLASKLDIFYGDDRWKTRLNNHLLRAPEHNEMLFNPAHQPGEQRLVSDLFGAKWDMHQRPAHLVEPPLQAPDLAGYTFPKIEDCFQPDWENKVTKFAEAHPDHFIISCPGFGIFERSWVLRGFEEMLTDVVLEPSFYESLIESITDHQLQIVDRMLKTPLDGILFSDDWGFQEGVLIGADRWRKFIKPHLKRLYDRVHQAEKIVLNHVCGSIREIMPDIIEIGLDVLESIQPEAKGMNPYELKREFGRDITFWGGLGSQSIIPHGTPSAIKAEVSKLVSEMGAGGGYILAPSKAIQPETPPENMAAMVESFVDQDVKRN
jgi:uroporphyrinogen decarboxylase